MAPSIVKRYAIAFSKYKFVGFAVFALSVGVSGLLGLEEPPPPTYVATGLMTLEEEPVVVSETGPNIQEQGRQSLTRDFLVDDAVAEQISQQVGVSPGQVKSAQVRTPKPDDPPLYGVTYQDSTPERAQAVVQLLMESSVEKSRLFNTSRLDSLIAALNERLMEVEQDLRQAENRLTEFERIEGAAFIMGKDGSLVSQIRGTQSQQEELARQLEQIAAQIQSLEGRLGLSVDEAYTSAALSRDPIINNLRGQIHQIETQRALLSQTLRPDHPQMVELQRQLSGLERLLESRAQEVIGGEGLAVPFYDSNRIRRDSSLDPTRQEMAGQLVALKTQQDTLTQSLAQARELEQELRAAYVNLPNLELEYERLTQAVAIKKTLYNNLQARLIDAETAKAETTGSLSIAQEPQVQKQEPEATNAAFLLVIGSGAGLAAGGAIIFLLSALEGRYYTMEEVRGALQERELKVLGTIPQIIPSLAWESWDDELTDFPVVLSANSPYLQYYERMRSNLQRVEGTPPKVVLVTSAGSEEGKSFTAYNLAVTAARAGKRTLLVEADLRSHSNADALKVAVDPEGTVEPLHHYREMKASPRFVPNVPNLYAAPSPGPQRHPAAVVESSELRDLLNEARIRFDFIVVDAPSLSECNDALVLEPLTDGLLMVARPGFTQNGLLAEYAEMFEEAGDRIRVIGSVVNDAEMAIELPEEEIVAEDETETPSDRFGYWSALEVEPTLYDETDATSRETSQTR